MAIHAIQPAGRETVSRTASWVHPSPSNSPFHLASGGVRSLSLWHDNGVLACALPAGLCSLFRAGVRRDGGPLAPYDRKKDHYVLNALLMAGVVFAMVHYYPSRQDIQRRVSQAFPTGTVE